MVERVGSQAAGYDVQRKDPPWPVPWAFSHQPIIGVAPDASKIVISSTTQLKHLSPGSLFFLVPGDQHKQLFLSTTSSLQR